MGLDITIYKTKKVNDFSAIDYYYANEAFDYYAEKELAKTNGWKFDFSLSKDWGIPETMTKEKIKPLQSLYSKQSTIFETVASWGKANQIHAWFVNNIQNGVDNNSYYFVTENDFLELKEICEEVLKLNPYNLTLLIIITLLALILIHGLNNILLVFITLLVLLKIKILLLNSLYYLNPKSKKENY